MYFDGFCIFATSLCILPTCAGVNLMCRCSGCMMMHSPRVRGGQPDFVIDAYATFVFSPHARGSTPFSKTRYPEMLILPACAGVIPTKKWKMFGPSDSPRMRGVNPSASHQGHCGRNFPRMREGQPAEQSAQFCIGNSPRMRGGQPSLIATARKKMRFSPRARGSTQPG